MITLQAWQALGLDAHSFISEPAALFVDPAAANYHLRPGSPAIDAAPSQGVYRDLEGYLRPAGAAFDIGAYEYGSSLPVPSATLFLPLVRRLSE